MIFIYLKISLCYDNTEQNNLRGDYIMDTERILSLTTFQNREQDFHHAAYQKELIFYTAVQTGNTLSVKLNMSPLDGIELGKLSSNSVTNMKYHLIISIALITRFCLEGGLPEEVAFTLSDYYIQTADTLSTLNDLVSLHKDMINDFTERMHNHTETVYSKPIVICLDYIYNNLHNKISLEQLASKVKLTPSYLSTLFSKETSYTPMQYIQHKRIEAAANMLKYSDYKIVDISNYFAFNSQSHFISVFKKEKGLTPLHYRNRYFKSVWKK